MSKIVQFSTIGALMSGFVDGEFDFDAHKNEKMFGIGCSEGMNGELTISNGEAWEATAGEDVHKISKKLVPFIQITNFESENSFECDFLDEENTASILKKKLNIENVFIAINIHAIFNELKIRTPQKSNSKGRTALDMVNEQDVSSLTNIRGQLIGFWTPEIYGRISVPGFHLHFLSDDKKTSGHVLQYHANKAIFHFQVKNTIEIKNPTNKKYMDMSINVDLLDSLISKVEK
ncbi:acetolactate decarboxylase [Erwinia tasmaniensis]|nr:acetolactate decarboxylase [Erwinia tasmaniensis]